MALIILQVVSAKTYKLISDRAFQWKISFNLAPIKKPKKVKSYHPSVYFNNILINSNSVHKHLGILLDDKLSHELHLNLS